MAKQHGYGAAAFKVDMEFYQMLQSLVFLSVCTEPGANAVYYCHENGDKLRLDSD